MSDISTLTTTVRHLIDDTSRTLIPGDIFTYTNSAVFILSESNAIAVTVVKRNGATLSSSNYSYDNSTQEVTISSGLTSGDTIEIEYTYCPNYSDSELESYIRSAFVHLSINNYYTYEVDASDNFFPNPTDKEKNLIAAITSVLIKPDNKTIRLPDMTINVPNSLPTRELVSQMIAIFKHNTSGVFEVIS